MDKRVKGLSYSERIRRYNSAIKSWLSNNPDASQREVDDAIAYFCKKYGV